MTANASSAFSDRLVSENQTVWDAMQTHRFVEELASGTMPEQAFHRYLVYEGAFVATAVRIFSLALAKAPTIEDQRWLHGVVGALLTEQLAYFERAYRDLGVDPAAFDRTAPGFTAFDRGMLTIAETGGFSDIVTAMFCAEWMYLNWCRAALARMEGQGFPREWVALHVAPGFEAQAVWLKSRIDALAGEMDQSERQRLTVLFGKVVELEIAFHTAAFG
ncbi:thiaminase (transcriptional activator TenA) [Fulvimarina manganoxydans]|uniref:Aminopyrimidine aminohydrolase n=1 Tax=Fulvimarina manganoxydans TaxID=937218 RepID=A0A1W2ES89_9HYPH|nr:TenA family protein [Fulvimarina manganoxydans]SMD12076.1 thiaminase (transcriptional activator TenA) [Fulvimarina manganoxydans]